MYIFKRISYVKQVYFHVAKTLVAYFEILRKLETALKNINFLFWTLHIQQLELLERIHS
jgi:hypothetical protein